jgi:hypothetical protein
VALLYASLACKYPGELSVQIPRLHAQILESVHNKDDTSIDAAGLA